MFLSEFFWNFSGHLFYRTLQTTTSEICRVSFLRISFCFFGQIYFNKHNSENFLIICLKEQRFYFAPICVVSNGWGHFFKQWGFCSVDHLQQAFRKQYHLWLSPFLTKFAVAQYKLHHRCLMSKFPEILILACRKIFCAFYNLTWNFFE